MGDLTPIFHIAGIAVATMVIESMLERTGHGDKVVFTRVVGYGIVAYYSIKTWYDYVRRIGSVFGVFV